MSDGEFDSLADMDLVQKLLKNPLYDIPERLRKKILGGAEKLMDKFSIGESSDAAFIAARRLVLEADKRNLALVKMVIPKKIEHKVVKDYTTEELVQLVREAQKLLPVLDV